MIHLFKITITDQDGNVYDTFDTEGWDLRHPLGTQAIATEFRIILDRIIARHEDEYDPWLYAKEVQMLTDGEEVWYPTEDGGEEVGIIRRADYSSGFHESQYTPFFRSYDLLEKWCKERIKKFREYAEAEKEYPDTTVWLPDNPTIDEE